MKKKIRKILSIVLPIAIGVFIIWWSMRMLTPSDKQDIKEAFFNANYFWIGVAVIIGLLSHLSRAYRWKFILEPMGYKPRFLNSVFSIFIAYLVNLTIPRAGEVVRATTISKYEGIPFEKAFGTIVAERMVDAVLLLTITLGALFYQFTFFKEIILSKVPQNPLSLILLVSITIIVLYVLFKFLRQSNISFIRKIRKFLKGLWEGIKSIWTMEKRWAYIFHSVFIWLMYLLMFYVVALAIEETSHLSLGGMISGFVAGAFGTTANGGLGTFPLAVKEVFSLYNIPGNEAFAFGWLMWTAQTLMIFLFGIVSIIAITLYNKKFLK